ncbi:hypothetical protein L228DRAFT_8831 [Xylona heveae TC161]|uniref:Uncharacterized protein n=1 Tax=Xylona heveae (strain CBS 132557 / TC161) TaxID=1328760 RepID=A0A165JI68_XYLHT|nr:hypothetical protein L228DRAFT_8831 [Xylona heveae TC161]KZF26272.1 hypothetical protein L228DRAFT_8831 [Xylona heveae TC161]
MSCSSTEAAFSSAADQLISLYIPPTVAVPIAVAIQSALSLTTGDINSVVHSALTAATPPPFLSAIPSKYSSNVEALESAISELRGVASTGISGAPRIITTTNSAGSTIVTTSTPSALSSHASSLSESLSSVASSLSSGASASASAVSGSASSAASSAKSSHTAATSSSGSASGTGATDHPASVSSTKSSTNWAAPTNLAGAVAGALGLVGMAIVL